MIALFSINLLYYSNIQLGNNRVRTLRLATSYSLLLHLYTKFLTDKVIVK